MNRIHLLRHAKSSWDDPGLADHDRPLAPRGIRASGLIAEHLRGEGIVPALVLCSSAVRTRQTLELIAPALGDGVEVRIESGIYGASEGALLRRLRELPDEVSSALLIGHNPGIEELTLELAAKGPELARVRAKFPTAALATLHHPGPWRRLDAGSAELVAFVKPKELARSAS